MENLTLSIKQEYFDQILSGTKKIETREIWANNYKKYCELAEDGFAKYDEENDVFVPRKYDTITFLTGVYKGTRPRMIVEVKNADIFVLQDEETGTDITYEHEGVEYLATQIDYHLGKIIQKPN